MRYITADKILTGTGKALANHVIRVNADGQIQAILPAAKLAASDVPIERYHGILSPGFVNTHCHLELSWAKNLIEPKHGLDFFLLKLGELRPRQYESKMLDAIDEADRSMFENGTVAVADVVNSGITVSAKAKSRVYYHTLVELFGSDPDSASRRFEEGRLLRSKFDLQTGRPSSIVPHSTYSLSDELYELIKQFTLSGNNLVSIHHQENEDENRFYFDGSGNAAVRRKMYFPAFEGWKGTGRRPMESIAQHFDTSAPSLFVHNTVSDLRDIRFILSTFAKPFWCFCPGANLYIEDRLPDIRLFRERGCKITIGTDSLASNTGLSMLEEMKIIHSNFPEVELAEMITWSTSNGAELLGISHLAGTIEVGKAPGIVLIENIDTANMQLLPESKSRLLIPAKL